jgi:beta-glucosidase/6-phospho-beta-glucosidase/beta-galactosidase
MRLMSIVVLLLGSCASGEDMSFSKGFLFGTATAGFQVEMGCPTVPAGKCEDRNSDWYTWVTNPAIVGDPTAFIVANQPISGSPGFYELWAQDLDRAANELHNNAFRLSIEWSRLFPTATDGIDAPDALRAAASADALTYYHALFAGMKSRGITPLVTLNHYTLPSWIHDAAACHADITTCQNRGWLDGNRVIKEIAKYAGFCAREFGGEVDLWATLNEPFTAVSFAGYIHPSADRSNPPGQSLDFDDAKQVTLNMITAHARMYDAVKANDTADADGDGKPARIGIVYNLQLAEPDDPTQPLDVQGAKNLDYLMNQMFLNAVAKGDLDDKWDGTTTHHDDLANRLDYLGINYYARTTIQGAQLSFFPQLSPLVTFNLFTLKIDWDHPQGIHDVIRLAQMRWGLPMIITETGKDDPKDDGSGAAWTVRSLAAVKRAIDEGSPVDGWFYWSLMDNFEWNHGMTVHMGLYGVDPADPQKTRHAKQSVPVYGRIAQGFAIPPDLIAKYPDQ